MHFNIKKANQYLPYILLIGIGIGTANYIMHGEFNWVQWILQSISTSLIIGYSLVSIAVNKSNLSASFKPSWKLYFFLFLVFSLLGVIATEVEQVIRSIVFASGGYQPFSGGKMYLFNGTISLVLGFSFFQNNHFFKGEVSEQDNSLDLQINQEQPSQNQGPIIQVPVKQGEAISLIPINDIAYFEAFDNYSFIHDLKGEKRLCDYSLLFLQKRLNEHFIRVHRKYIVNTVHIKQIKPHSNARYLIHFDSSSLSPITSSKSYSNSIRSLIKIK